MYDELIDRGLMILDEAAGVFRSKEEFAQWRGVRKVVAEKIRAKKR